MIFLLIAGVAAVVFFPGLLSAFTPEPATTPSVQAQPQAGLARNNPGRKFTVPTSSFGAPIFVGRNYQVFQSPQGGKIFMAFGRAGVSEILGEVFFRPGGIHSRRGDLPIQPGDAIVDAQGNVLEVFKAPVGRLQAVLGGITGSFKA